ncbi:hypothetical protein [Nocardia vinacea]|uniref:hypothetical protein n=1 Tax=Nocardia vinacea TaxID=96468 RepID=UPI0012F6AABC|nr:hypothetical protein [Nocardia vinacea]
MPKPAATSVGAIEDCPRRRIHGNQMRPVSQPNGVLMLVDIVAAQQASFLTGGAVKQREHPDQSLVRMHG